jgi:hypothetical protein
MPVGQGALYGFDSYLAVGRETTLGTYNTCTAGLDFMSESLKTMKESKVLEQIERTRTYSKRVQLSKKCEGDIEGYYQPLSDACNFLLQNAMGGTITSATATGETVGGGAFSHTFALGSMDQSYPSLCINVRKGGSSGGKVWQYHGVRVNELTFSAEIDEALKFSTSLIGMDSTQNSNDVASVLSSTSHDVLSFVSGRVSVETSFGSLTSTSFWHVQSVEFGISNSLKNGADARRLGTDALSILPVGVQSFPLTMKIRFDTTTAYDAMMNGTQLSAQLEFLGSTITGSAIRQGLKINIPRIYVEDAGDPEIGGPDEVLMSEVTFQVLRDVSSATGYAVQLVVTNTKSSYA